MPPVLEFDIVERRRGLLRRKQWMWTCTSTRNGRQICNSGEGFNNYGDCEASMNLVRNNAADAKAPPPRSRRPR